MDLAKLVLEYIRILLSPQIIIGAVVALTFFLLFKKELQALINRIATIKFPGGELSTQSQKLKEELVPRKEPPIDIE